MKTAMTSEEIIFFICFQSGDGFVWKEAGGESDQFEGSPGRLQELLSVLPQGNLCLASREGLVTCYLRRRLL